jgi:hypothetical protein
VTFAGIGSNDLHVAGGSIGDVQLIGTPIGGITSDIDGDTRNVSYPYMGADENLGSPLPVQISTVTATALDLGAQLRWTTATETNNFGFEIERRAVTSETWAKVGFVTGVGVSSSPHEYSFVDKSVSPGHYAYRIKQVDKDGSFEYAREVQVEVGLAPKEFTLGQNYPNPFNPSTRIEFTVPENGRATLKVYSVLGQEVATLFDGDAEAGRYLQATFDARGLASGMYFSVLKADGKQLVKKMILMK